VGGYGRREGYSQMPSWSNRRDEKLCSERQPAVAANSGESESTTSFGGTPEEWGSRASDIGHLVFSVERRRFQRIPGRKSTGKGRDCTSPAQDAARQILARAWTSMGCNWHRLGGTLPLFGSEGPHPGSCLTGNKSDFCIENTDPTKPPRSEDNVMPRRPRPRGAGFSISMQTALRTTIS
jgi:hypothetical protein